MKFCGHWGRNSPQARSSTGCVVRDGTAEDPSQGMERITNESSNPKDLSQRSVPGVCHLTEVQYFSSGDFSLDELACSRLPHLQTSETLNLDSPYNSLVLRYLPNMFRRGVLVESKLPLAANNSNFSICQEDNRGPSSSQLDESRADITAAHVNRSVKLDLSFLCNLPADGESSELDQESNILNRTIKCDRVVVNSDEEIGIVFQEKLECSKESNVISAGDPLEKVQILVDTSRPFTLTRENFPVGPVTEDSSSGLTVLLTINLFMKVPDPLIVQHVKSASVERQL
eukprot:CAMPEP_0184688486 /NCGR_PEP_ID=MMETSP0312-20130426/30043_1 /TAXON_ID=31354 /ORGANISM="Compsopogon coeruleus, Strain SAG 36.94" /LENGTH=285 /DNA_ID=CAMNT_0027145703 /DNA_START=326 /DNA_END=1184 /DNA_ORIENTATION=-